MVDVEAVSRDTSVPADKSVPSDLPMACVILGFIESDQLGI